MFGSLGFTELVLILFIVLIIFGAGRLPQLGEGLGKAIKGFKKSVNEADALEAEAQADLQTPAVHGSAPPGPSAMPLSSPSETPPHHQPAAVSPPSHA